MTTPTFLPATDPFDPIATDSPEASIELSPATTESVTITPVSTVASIIHSVESQEAMGWVAPEDLEISFEEWGEGLTKLLAMNEGIQWVGGDFLVWGKQRFDDLVYEFMQHRHEKTLANWERVARKIPIEHRRHELTWSHHLQASGLDTLPETITALKRAVEESMSSYELRGYVNSVKQKAVLEGAKKEIERMREEAESEGLDPDEVVPALERHTFSSLIGQRVAKRLRGLHYLTLNVSDSEIINVISELVTEALISLQEKNKEFIAIPQSET